MRPDVAHGHAHSRGDSGAFGALYDRYADDIHRLVYLRIADRAVAEDITSETFLRALRSIRTVSRRGSDVGAWFTTIARNTCSTT